MKIEENYSKIAVIIVVIAVDIPLVENAVDATAVVFVPADAVATVIDAPVKLCVPVHVAPAFKLLIAVVVYAVDAAFVEFSAAVLVKISKSYRVVAGDDNSKVVELPNESVIIDGALKVNKQLISLVVIVVVVISPSSIIVPPPSS